MLVQCWSAVGDYGPASNHHWANVSCLLGIHCSNNNPCTRKRKWTIVRAHACRCTCAAHICVTLGLSGNTGHSIFRPLEWLFASSTISCYFVITNHQLIVIIEDFFTVDTGNHPIFLALLFIFYIIITRIGGA